jgi:hypothetical protein
MFTNGRIHYKVSGRISSQDSVPGRRVVKCRVVKCRVVKCRVVNCRVVKCRVRQLASLKDFQIG